MSLPVIIQGNGGHAAVVFATLRMNNHAILGFTAPENTHRFSENIAYLGPDESIKNYSPQEVQLANGLGSTDNTRLRGGLCSQFQFMNYQYSNVIHPTAIIANSVTHGEGLQLLAGAIINPSSTIGNNVLVNSSALIEHHCNIDDHCHIAPGAIICGDVTIGQSVHVGAGATILQGVCIGDHAVIAAGAVVTDTVRPLTMVAGVPAKEKKILTEEDY